MIPPSKADFEREICSRRLKDYVLRAWPQVEPARPFKDNWHIDAICEHLEAVHARQITRLVINVPPGTMKSLLCGVFWPSWVWTKDAEAKWITASYSPIVSRRDAYRAQRLMETPWYQDRWGHLWRPNFGDWGATKYSNSKAGFRLAVTVAGGATGEHADHQLVDDPIKPLDARGARADSSALAACIEWWDETMTTRVVDPETSTRTIIMQRLHDRDLAGHVLAAGGYVHLNLPMRYEPRCVVSVPHACSLKEDARGSASPPTPIGFKDGRVEGALLWPERFPEKVQAQRKKELGSRGVAAQDQQRPMPSGGGIFQRDWIRYWTALPKAHGRQIIQSWDCAFKGTDDSDFVVGQVWMKLDGNFYLIDQVRGRMGFSATCHAVIALSAKHPKAVKKLIEAKANGDAVIDALKRKVPGLIAVNPEGGKVARANAVEPLWEAGNVYLPANAPWVGDLVEELVAFNGDPGRHDDQVDAATQALTYLHRRTAAGYREAMKNAGMFLG